MAAVDIFPYFIIVQIKFPGTLGSLSLLRVTVPFETRALLKPVPGGRGARPV